MQDAPVTVRSGGSLQLNAVNFTNNTNAVGPAAVRTDEGAQLNIDGSVFGHNSGNRSTIYITDGSSLTVSNSRLVNNRANLGGGVLLIDSQQERTTVMIEGGSEFHGNEALTGEGGAIFAIGNVSLAITDDTIFRRNVAALQGGALFFSGHSTLTIQDAFFVENESNFSGGGAIYAQNSMNEDLDIQISNTIFSKNAATNQLGSGGAIRLDGSGIKCNIDRSVNFVSNVAELDGAAIHISDGPEVNISESSFIGNEAREGGGSALFILSSAYSGSSIKLMTLRIMSSMFIHNRAVYGRRGGGTIGSTGMGAQIFIDGCKFHGNEAMFGSGGVIYLFEGPFITARNSSFIDNKAIWGGVIYGQLEANFNMSDCTFHRNEAEEGGVISSRGFIMVDIMESEFKNNSAKEEGGAIRAENHDYSTVDTARLTITNTSFENNNAGFEIRQGGLDIESTRGGGIVAIGAGQYMVIDNTTFRNNSASEGGALAAIGPGQFLVTEHSVFENNFANFGSAIFIFVNNAIDIWRDRYQITDAVFENNTANSDGGAVRVGSSTLANNLFPYNARRRTVVFRHCIFRNNRALNLGGGLMVIGVGLELDGVSFTSNIAVQNAGLSMSGSGGGIAAIDGASVKIANSDITSNVAYLSGGGLFVMDSSVAISKSNFTQNSLREGYGNGGAVALTLTANRLLPILESGERQVPILFECNNCEFVGNKATLYGGAIYYHNSDPYANYTEDWNCENTDVSTFTEFQNAPEFNLTCVWIIRTRDRLRSRVIRLSRVLFESNRAQSGAALFTNNPAMIRITNGEPLDLGNSFVDTVENESALNEFGIIFRDNEKAKDGYGQDYSSYPVKAFLFSRDSNKNETSSANLTFSKFQSGGRLNFEIRFEDAFDQNVFLLHNFTAEISIRSENTSSQTILLTGQRAAPMEQNGVMNFTETRLVGEINKIYTIDIQFILDGEEVEMSERPFINVTIRPCRIGEETEKLAQGVIRCVTCGEGQFNSNPENGRCEPCEDIEGVKCFGNAAIPEKHYWHASSSSISPKRCIGQESCDYNNRSDKIKELEIRAHENGTSVSYTEDQQREQCEQCSQGYTGILCGSCTVNYGREGDICRQCASRGVRYFVVIMLALWSIIFVGYFIRSVLQLAKRIEFNKKFRGVSGPNVHIPAPTESIPGLSSINRSISDGEIQPDYTDQHVLELQPYIEETNTYPVPKSLLQGLNAQRSLKMSSSLTLANQNSAQNNQSKTNTQNPSANSMSYAISNKRKTRLAARLQQIKNDPAMKNMDPLTLANPVSEVLINFIQVTSLAVSINVDWTKAVRRTLAVLGAAGNLATGAGYSSIDCFLKSGSVPKSLRRMTIMLLYPILLFFFFAFCWGLRTFIKRRSFEFFKRRLWLVVLALNYFFYIGMTKNLLRFFACVKVDEEWTANGGHSLNGYYWEEDTSVECYHRRHALLLGILVIPLIFAITIGFPLGTLIILAANSHRLDDEEVIKTYGFLYRAYDNHYWEILIILRKGLIATVAVFDYGLGENIQGLLCVMVLGSALALHLIFVPFSKEMPQLNRLETCSLSATIAVFLSGLLFNDSKTGDNTKVFLSVVAILFVVIVLLMILFELFLSTEEAIDMWLLEHGIMDDDGLLENRLSLKVEKMILHMMRNSNRSRSSRRRTQRRRRVNQPQASFSPISSNVTASGSNPQI
eukprot:g3558.t1